jgi:hypothetical protein
MSLLHRLSFVSVIQKLRRIRLLRCFCITNVIQSSNWSHSMKNITSRARSSQWIYSIRSLQLENVFLLRAHHSWKILYPIFLASRETPDFFAPVKPLTFDEADAPSTWPNSYALFEKQRAQAVRPARAGPAHDKRVLAHSLAAAVA